MLQLIGDSPQSNYQGFEAVVTWFACTI